MAEQLGENSRQGFAAKKPSCIGLESDLSRNLRWGCGHVYDETPLGLAVYVRNDPVNRIDPDGRDSINVWQYYETLGMISSLPFVNGVSGSQNPFDSYLPYYEANQWALYSGQQNIDFWAMSQGELTGTIVIPGDTAGSSGVEITAGIVGGAQTTGNQPFFAPPSDATITSSTAQITCTLDAMVNYGLGFIPGYNIAAGLIGFNFNPFQAATYNGSLLEIDINPFQIAAGGGELYGEYARASFGAAGGSSALNRLNGISSRRGFSARSAAAHANVLRRASKLSKLGKAASFAGTVGQALNIGNFIFDAIRCWK